VSYNCGLSLKNGLEHHLLITLQCQPLLKDLQLNQTDLLPTTLFSPPTDSPPGLRLRLVTDRDRQSLYHAFYSHEPMSQFQAQFGRVVERQRTGRSFWLISELATGLVGSGQLIIYPHGTELANINVVEDYQSQGIGTALIHVLTAIARHIGLASVEIGVSASNSRALALYHRLGFQEDRRLHFAGGEPAIILRKAL